MRVRVPELLESDSVFSQRVFFVRRSFTRAFLESEPLFPEFLSSWYCARGLASGPSREAQTGDAAAPVCVVDLRARTWSAGEGSPAAWEAGTRRDQADGRGREGLDGHTKRGSSFLYFCMHAVAPCP